MISKVLKQMIEEVSENLIRATIMSNYMARLSLESPTNNELKNNLKAMKFEVEGNAKLKKYLEEYKVKPELKA